MSDDAIYPIAFMDGDGKMVDGANKYVIHLERYELPRAIVVSGPSPRIREHFNAHNSIEQCFIASWMPLTYDADESLDVYVQARSPDAN